MRLRPSYAAETPPITDLGLSPSENFWARRSYSAVASLGEDTVLSKTVYPLNNPVAAGLVRYSKHWLGCLAGWGALSLGTPGS